MHFTPVRFLRTSISAALVSVVALSSFSIYGANDEKIDNVVEKIEQESNGNISIEIPPAILELILQK